ncbi:MAG TPA: bifunctional 4-hydroxy-2-oxoglutarate aldolase/2-dehydro-3-deoxy-phosphogluconate aldolase [Gemmatimonadaceae bacterium]|nr:bifunctional 4-hydroxy-2-oxoglutarate aldolase/2-dehydro-3-deoxy-phosphogluconate aldolase [Gemmatimonadaceae bacterium]
MTALHQSSGTNAERAVTMRLRELRLVPVIVIEDSRSAPALGRALIEGGLPCAEVTFRTKGAREALTRLAGECPDILAGAGTVLTRGQAAEARAAGARFIVAPGFNPVVVDYCLEEGIPVFPGIATPSELEAALTRGLSVVKFFPAEPLGGLTYLKAISAPYGAVEFMPTGGITLENVTSYLGFPKVVACGGSWMAPSDWITAGNFDGITAEVKRAVTAVQQRNGASDK